MTDVLIVYDSIHGNTERVAGRILEAVRASGAEAVMKKTGDVTESDLKEARGIIIGSPCIGDTYSRGMREFLDGRMTDTHVDGKVGAAFGTYKWNGGNLRQLEVEMERHGIRKVAGGVNIRRHPDDEHLRRLKELGLNVGREALKLPK